MDFTVLSGAHKLRVAYDAHRHWQSFVSALVIRWCQFDFYVCLLRDFVHNLLHCRCLLSGSALLLSLAQPRTLNQTSER